SSEVEVLRAAAEKARAEADAEAAARREAEKRAGELAAKAEAAVLPLEMPGRAVLGVPLTGAVNLEKLAQLVTQLALARVDVRLELKSQDALRTTWLRRGLIVAAASSVPHESLLDRARRDGLIDGKQENDLRLLRASSSPELLRVLKARSYIREIEAVPLVQ